MEDSQVQSPNRMTMFGFDGRWLMGAVIKTDFAELVVVVR